jgi:hypothetical protein
MALQVDITDEKGVKTRYHKIRSILFDTDNIVVTMRSYVNQATRDAEKKAVEGNALATKYDNEINDLRAQLDELSAQLQPNGEGDPAVIEQIKELSQQLNDKVSAPDRPQYYQIIDKYYNESTIELPIIDPVTLDALYVKLASVGQYNGAVSV